MGPMGDGRVPADVIVSDRTDAALYVLYALLFTCLAIVFVASFFVSATGKAAAVAFVLVVSTAFTRVRLHRRIERRLGHRFPVDTRTYAFRDRNFDRLDVLGRSIRLMTGRR